MHLEFSGSFPDYTIFICKFKIDERFFFIHGTFLVYKLEMFKHCKMVKHIMIMIIATIYIFYLMWYLINSWKLLSENPQASLKKTTPTLKIQKFQVPHFWPTLKLFQAPRAERVGEDTMNSVTKCEIKVLGQMQLCSKIWKQFPVWRNQLFFVC